MSSLPLFLRYYVAVCKLCNWQWAITSEQKDVALKGCPECGAGANKITLIDECPDE